MKTLLYLTDLYYKANSRNYYEEDLYITSKLTGHFNLLIGHPQQALSCIGCADLVVFRNTGPVIYYRDYFNKFVEGVKEKGLVTFNSFDGKADIKGKEYLLQLYKEGYPVIPTVNDLKDINALGDTEKYIVKLEEGADSIGMEVLTKEALLQTNLQGKLVQPFVDFVYEVSFYYLNNRFQYALYAPDKKQRWNLTLYAETEADLRFASAFVQWNNMTRGIVRIDACRLKDGSLLLVEIEDLNPYLSIDLLTPEKREEFITAFIDALKEL